MEGHSITFDGTDNDGKLLKPGGYIIKVITSFGDSWQNILNLVYTGNQSCLDFNTDYNMHAMTDEFGNFSIDFSIFIFISPTWFNISLFILFLWMGDCMENVEYKMRDNLLMRNYLIS